MSKQLAAALAIAAALMLAPAAQARPTVAVGPLGSGQVGADVTFAEGTVHIDTIYTVPEPDPSIFNNLTGLINRAEPGSYIAGAIYSIDDDNAIDTALQAAAGRGVDLWLVLDSDPDHDNTAAFADWTAAQKSNLHYRKCERGCLSTTPDDANGHAAIQHMKYYTFSRTQRYAGGAFSPAAWVGSANSDANTGLNASNNAVSIFSDSNLNAELEKVFRDQWKGAVPVDQSPYPPYFDYYIWPATPTFPRQTEGNGAFFSSTSGTVGIFSPDQDGDRDESKDLWKVQLGMLQPPPLSSGQLCRVVAFQNHLDTARFAAVHEFSRLAEAGCKVQIVANFIDKPGVEDDDVEIGDRVRKDLCEDTSGDLTIIAVRKMHQKAVAANAMFNGSWRSTVWTGSHNLSGPALNRNDEILFRLDSAPKLADEFFREWGILNTDPPVRVC